MARQKKNQAVENTQPEQPTVAAPANRLVTLQEVVAEMFPGKKRLSGEELKSAQREYRRIVRRAEKGY